MNILFIVLLLLLFCIIIEYIYDYCDTLLYKVNSDLYKNINNKPIYCEIQALSLFEGPMGLFIGRKEFLYVKCRAVIV